MKLKFIHGLYIGSIGSLIATLTAVTVIGHCSLDTYKLNALSKHITKYYYKDVSKTKLSDEACKGMVSGLDKYSEYYTAEEYKKIKTGDRNFSGVGIQYQRDLITDCIKIVGIVKGTSADKIGLKRGDIITKIGDEYVSDLSNDAITDKVRGRIGTTVKFTVKREGVKDELTFKLERCKVNSPYVTGQRLTKDTGYIKIEQFWGDASSQFKDMLDKLETDNYIIDLRDNGGGVIDVLLDILNQIIPNGLVATLEDTNGNQEFKTTGNVKLRHNFVLLVNENTASCSEIMCGVFQDMKYGTVIGEKTYGKGVVQTVAELTDGSAIKITTGKYKTPKGRDLNKKGITPDIILKYKYDGNDEIGDKDLMKDNQVLKGVEVLGKRVKNTN